MAELDGTRRDPSSGHDKQLLLGFIKSKRDARDRRREINAELADQRKAERKAGFDPKQIEAVVRWLEECEDKGREVVDEAEALFELYRNVADGAGLDFDEIMTDARDRALLKIFAPEDQLKPGAPTRKQKAVSDALAGCQASAWARGIGKR